MPAEWLINPQGGAEISLPLPGPSFLPKRTMRLRLQPFACGAVRVTRTMRDAFLDKDSEIVIDRATAACRVTEEENAILVDCDGVTARVDALSGSIVFLGPDGETLLREHPKHPCVLQQKPVMVNRFRQDAAITYTQSIDGIRASSEDYETVQDRTSYECKLSFVFDPGEGLYGLGSHEEGFGNLRGKSREMYQHNMKAVVPLLLSTKGWGLLMDLGCLMTFHDDPNGSYLWADCADEMDVYFLWGGVESVYRQYAALTGPAPLLPKYAFGYVQSKERYKDAAELISVVKEYRRRQVPLDVIVQDWRSWPEGQWGYKIFDETRFPDPQALTDELHAMGAKMMLSIWPSMQGDENENRKEMLENGCMLGNRTIYNAFRDKARELYWKQAEEGLFRYGVDAWWCDCTEPFESDWHGAIKPEPFERVRLNTEEAKKYMDPGKINLYSLYQSRGIYEGQRKATDAKRVLNLTRSSYAGQHRYATVTWSGDVASSWEVLRRQVPEGMNFMAAGEGWWTTDAGGFFPMDFGGAWFGTGEFNGGVSDPGYRELFVRWLQFGAFLPMMRAHGSGTPREIWQFGEKGEKWYDAIEKAIRLRSRLLPSLYSLAAEYASRGVPMVLFPALIFPEDAALLQVDDEMMLGGQLLVKPVTRPHEYLPEGKPIQPVDDTESVYLPAGAAWYAWETGEALPGGQTIRVSAPLDTVPLFVKAGSVVLTGPVQQYADELPDAPLTVTVYPGADGAFTWYDDAGDGYGCERDEWARVRFAWQDDRRTLSVSAREGGFPGMQKERKLLIRLTGGAEKEVLYTGDELQIPLS